MKKIFFVIPVYKGEKYLKRCVESVLMQTYPDFKIILVDDGSPDGCPGICDDFAEKYENISVIHKENGGLSDARNAGIRYVQEVADRDDYLTFLDSDDYVRSDFSKRMIELMEKNNCNMAQCDYEKGNKDGFSPCSYDTTLFVTDSEQALLGYRLKSQSCAKVYRLSTFDDVLFPVGMYNEDEFVTYRAVYQAKRIVFTDEKLYYYYQHGTSIMEEVAKKLKNNPHKYDYLKAYEERSRFFEEKNLPEQVMKTKEKICTDIILRYCEQMYLKKSDRDTECIDGTYMRIYRENYKLMIKRPAIPIKRKLMYQIFYRLPLVGVLMGKLFTLRK